MFLVLALVQALAVLAGVHEARSVPPSYALHTVDPDPSSRLGAPLRFFLVQSNLNNAPSALQNVSDPSSPYFGQHWNAKRVAEFFRPRKESVDAVKRWLQDEGIDARRIRKGNGDTWIGIVDPTVAEAQRLLDTTYSNYVHKRSGSVHFACRNYSLPFNISRHVDFVHPTLQFDYHAHKHGHMEGIGQPSGGSTPKLGNEAQNLNAVGLDYCDAETTLACLQALYKIPPPSRTNKAFNTLEFGIVEYTPQSYLPPDLDFFYEFFLSQASGTRPILESIDGGQLQTEFEDFDDNGESDLDLQYAIGLLWPNVPLLYQVGDLLGEASFGNFLDALDGSYCTYGGGDDPSIDGVYPDPGGYEGPEACGTAPVTNVISTSYSYDEVDLPASYEIRQCNEYLKLGLMGVTMLFSSGDDGVAGYDGDCIDASTGQLSPFGTLFAPSFPSTCPWVTSVGATQIVPGANVYESEEACETYIYSGGGFSNVFQRAFYQDPVVEAYLAAHPIPASYDIAGYRPRAFPDISANGANYVVAVDGVFELVYGTSASSPVVGSMFTMINMARHAAGKSNIGFVNFALYGNPGLFNDITSGNNPGCGTNGFEAVAGYDPVTGLGTIDYETLLDYYMSIP